MATANTAPPKFNFPGPVGTKRRRMRSGGNVSTLSNNNAASVPSSDVGHLLKEPLQEEPVVTLDEADDVGEKVVQTSKCKGATTIPIFLKKTYKMIDTCDPTIASWTPEGDMFVVKDPDVFASQVIPQYFDHNKFSSFARQLNFYGFRKMQSKPIRNSDFDAGTAKHVTFFNENFKRGRCDLLKKIQRSTRGSGAGSGQDQAREIQTLRDQVSSLEAKIQEMATSSEERLRRLELDLLARIEQVMMAMQQQQQAQLRLQSAGTVNSTANSMQIALNNANSNVSGSGNVANGQRQQSQGWESLQSNLPRTASAATAGSSAQQAMNFAQPPQRQPMQQTASGGSAGPSNNGGGPTLPPHPKQKQLPMNGFPGAMGAPPDRFNSLRGISALSRGLSGAPRGTSVESSASAVLLRNSWEDKFFSMLMLDEQNAQNAAAAAAANQTTQQSGSNDPSGNMMAPTPFAYNGNSMGGMSNNGVQPAMVSNGSMETAKQRQQQQQGTNPADDLSSVSSSDIP